MTHGSLVAAAAIALAGCAAKAEVAQHTTPVPVTIARAQAAGTEPIFSGPASVVAAHTYRLAFEVPGRIAAVNADVGDRVGAGTVLARLDDEDYRAQAVAASARAASAQAQATKADTGSRPQEKAAAAESVRAARAQLAQAQAALTLAQADVSRSQRLYSEGAIAAQANDGAVAAERDARARVDAASAALISAQNQAALVAIGPRSEDRTAASAEARAARASAALADITLRKTVLRAPADAYVLSRSVELGDEAAPGVIAFTLTDAAPADIIAAVPEAHAGALHVGMPARLRAGSRTFAVRVTRIEPQADATTRTVSVRMHADDVSLRPGAVVIAEIGSRGASGASVPLGAVVTSTSGSASVALYERNTNSVRMQPVTIIRSIGDRAIVRGIAPGQTIVTAGQYQARSGASVTVVSQEN